MNPKTAQQDLPTVSIVGSGWLGLALAKYLTTSGFSVRISTTSESKRQALTDSQYNIHKIKIESESSLSDSVNQTFFNAECVIIAIPPHQVADYQALIQKLLTLDNKGVILISSTSVYRMTNADVIESDLDALDADSKMLAIERLFQNSLPHTTVLRFGGLIGDGRHPVKWFAGRQQVSASNAPVNFIHQHDCVKIIQAIISQKAYGKVFNACADTHPTKAELYSKLFQQAGIDAPKFIEQYPLSFKRVNSDYIKQELNYQFQFGELERLEFKELI
jgi:nucleoside-diphosphate-sugar epimerase